MIKLELPPLYQVDSGTHNGFQKLSYELMDGFAKAFYYHSYTTGSFEGEALTKMQGESTSHRYKLQKCPDIWRYFIFALKCVSDFWRLVSKFYHRYFRQLR